MPRANEHWMNALFLKGSEPAAKVSWCTNVGEEAMPFRASLKAAAIALAVVLAPAAPAAAGELSIAVGPPAIVDGGWHHISQRHYLSPREVRRILRDEGFRQIEFLDRDGRIYVARAENYRGRDVIVRVSARSGTIISVERVRRRGGHGWDGHHGDDRPQCWLPEGCWR